MKPKGNFLKGQSCRFSLNRWWLLWLTDLRIERKLHFNNSAENPPATTEKSRHFLFPHFLLMSLCRFPSPATQHGAEPGSNQFRVVWELVSGKEQNTRTHFAILVFSVHFFGIAGEREKKYCPSFYHVAAREEKISSVEGPRQLLSFFFWSFIA